jgi:hypothetical protein
MSLQENNLHRTLSVLTAEQAHVPLSPDAPSGRGARMPVNYEKARAALAECVRLDECKAWRDKAQAIASYAKQARNDDLAVMAIRIKARATRRLGELLESIEPPKNQHHARAQVANGRGTRADAERRAGISPRQGKQARRVARVPLKAFEEQVEAAKPPTIERLARQGTQAKVVPMNGRAAATKLMWMLDKFARDLAGVDIAAAGRGLSKKDAARLGKSLGIVRAFLPRVSRIVVDAKRRGTQAGARKAA